MITRSCALTLVLIWSPAHLCHSAAQRQRPEQLKKLLEFGQDGKADLHVWADAANSYVLRDGDRALLIDIGDGSVLDQLSTIGVRTVEWVLFTHHHREQVQGARLLAKWRPKIAVPEAERPFFETPFGFRKMKPSLSDRFTVHGSSYVRPPVDPIKADAVFRRMDNFTWRGRSIVCVETKGNSPGGMSYLIRRNKGWIAFSCCTHRNDLDRRIDAVACIPKPKSLTFWLVRLDKLLLMPVTMRSIALIACLAAAICHAQQARESLEKRAADDAKPSSHSRNMAVASKERT